MLLPAVTRWEPLAAASAARWGSALGVRVPVELVLAVLDKESSGNPRAMRVESDGRISRGLMQVLEGTAADLGVRDPQALHDPRIGIDVGTHYLAQKLRAYSGRVAPAVAAYNAGSARFDQREHYVNQGYVDAVLYRFAHAIARLPRPSAQLALALGVALLAGTAATVARQRRRGRAA